MNAIYFNVGDTAHFARNMTIFGKRFKSKDAVKILEVYPKHQAYLCEIEVKGEKREVELSQTSFISPKAWELTLEQDAKIKEFLQRSDTH